MRSRSLVLRLPDAALYALMKALAQVTRALPSRWVLRIGDLIGECLAVLDRRGARVARQNLDVVFAEACTPREKRRIHRASLRNAGRAVMLMVHVSPMTPGRLSPWVDVPEALRAGWTEGTDGGKKGGVLVSAHFGNWELLLGIDGLLPELPSAVFLAEGLSHPAFDRFFNDVRGSGGSRPAARKGGARAVSSHVRGGGAAALLADRNVMRAHGGVWAPFFGLSARTTPLPGWLAVTHGVDVRTVFCVPRPDGRCRVEGSGSLTQGLEGLEPAAAILEIATRLNREIEARIREAPELWNWSLKRFKARPHRELGPYPPYSVWDPDPEPASATAPP
jgi:KDO2-lipid IV(A) lauroyltransferase